MSARSSRARESQKERIMSTLKPLRQPRARQQGGRRVAGRGVSAASQRPPLLPFYALFGLIVVAGVALLAVRARQGTALAPSSIPVDQAVRPLNAPTGQTSDGYWYKGQADAPVTVVEFGDFQCPSCGAAFRALEGGIDRDYVETGKVMFVFHDFPLPQHANAVPAAQAARAAGAQGKFWAMHDLLYSRQAEWENDSNVIPRLEGYAAELGLDQQAFNQALESQQYAGTIQAAIQDANRQGISATPTYLVDGKAVDASGLRAAIDAALKAQGQ
jgi:protein-disulfide isomerase